MTRAPNGKAVLDLEGIRVMRLRLGAKRHRHWRPFFPDAASEGELAYRLWRYGLELALAEAASLGTCPPSSTTELLLARLVARRLLLVLPLLRRTDTLDILGLDAAPPDPDLPRSLPVSVPPGSYDTIDERASEAIASLGGSDFR